MRRPYFHPNRAGVPSPSPLQELYPQAFDGAFANVILPCRELGSFAPTDAPLYMIERETQENGESVSDPETYEAYLDRLFWAQGTSTLIFVEGPVGSGKSTLVEYYLRCYCPHSGNHRDDFDRKLILYSDFRSTPSVQEFDRRLYKQARAQILAGCSAANFPIEIADNFEFWNSIFDFSGPLFLAGQGDADPKKFRADYVLAHGPNVSDERWVHAALKYLARKQGSSDCRYRFLVLCLDNLDQSNIDVLRHAIYRVRELTELAGRFPIWRVFVPVRPNTLNLIRDEVHPLPPYAVLTITSPKLEKLIDQRTDVLQASISLPVAQAAQSLDKTPDQGTNMGGFIRNCREWASSRFQTFVTRVSAGSARTSLELWRCVMSNRALYENYLERAANPARRPFLGHYVLVNGLLCAQYPVYHADQHPILNLFNLLPERNSPPEAIGERDLLIGVHTLALMRRNITDYKIFVDTLYALGYGVDDVDSVLCSFGQRYFYREIRHRAIYPDRAVTHSYWGLLEESAYIEQVAYVTPLEPDIVKNVKHVFGTMDDASFIARCNTAIAFLFQLSQDEKRFCKVDACPAGTDRDKFRRVLGSGWIPSVFKISAQHYRKELGWLHERGYFEGLTNLQWGKLLQHSVFENANKAVPVLQPSE